MVDVLYWAPWAVYIEYRDLGVRHLPDTYCSPGLHIITYQIYSNIIIVAGSVWYSNKEYLASLPDCPRTMKMHERAANLALAGMFLVQFSHCCLYIVHYVNIYFDKLNLLTSAAFFFTIFAALSLAPLVVKVNPNLNVILTACLTVYVGCYRSVKPTPPSVSNMFFFAIYNICWVLPWHVN